MLEDVSGRAWLRRAKAQKCIAGCCGAKLQSPVFAPKSEARKAGHRQKAHVYIVGAVLRVTLHLQC